MDITAPLALILLASFFLGSFGLGMKYVRPMAWEAWWLLYSVAGMVLLPILWAAGAVPAVWESIATSPTPALRNGALFGFLWGIGGILFGRSVQHIGMSLTYGIVMGLSATAGALLPLARVPDAGSLAGLWFVLGGVVLMLGAVVIIAWAGVLRDRLRAASDVDPEGGLRNEYAYRTGLGIAVLSGVLSSLLNVGFDHASPVAQRAIELGALPRNSSLAAWLVVLSGAFLLNGGYAVTLLWRHRTLSSFTASGNCRPALWAITTGLLWFASFGVYGQGAAMLGPLGPVVGWPMLLGLGLVTSNLWAWRAGEWDGARYPFHLMVSGVLVILIACALLGYANSLS